MSILWPFPSLPSCLENSGCSWGWRRNWKPRAHREQRAFGAGLWGLTSGRRWHQSRIRSRATQTAAHGYVDLDRYYGLRPTVRVSGNALEAGNVAIAPVAMCQKRHQCHFIHYYVVVSPFKAQFKAKWLKRKVRSAGRRPAACREMELVAVAALLSTGEIPSSPSGRSGAKSRVYRRPSSHADCAARILRIPTHLISRPEGGARPDEVPR
jgi:hypothetical protein